jgi:hypothetical protein
MREGPSGLNVLSDHAIYKAIAADAAACGMTPKQFAERFMDQAIRGGFICTVETGKNR